ncbi:MAG TPA: HAD-IIA family hydrolase [Streptosporangiaceae bacterium]|nr:HAD-IIA family hydrolase [Streptosporangiaceae bacterium]
MGNDEHTPVSDLTTVQPPSTEYDVALLDLDGVVYTGQGAVPNAVTALAQARAGGLRLAFVTNNASRTPSAVAAHLSALGVPATQADVVTSAQAAARLIAARVPPGSRVLVAGSVGLRLALRARGLRPVSVAADRPVAVVVGFSPAMNWALLTEAALAVRAGALFVATNADPTLPSPRGLQPGNGSLLRVIATATGIEPVVAGKPEPPLHREAVARTGCRRPLVVGDRLDTDIEGATRGGADSMLVLSGVSTPRELVLAAPSRRPSYVAEDLRGLLEPQPVVGVVRGGAAAPGAELQAWAVRCGGWTARRMDAQGPVTLEGDGDRLDGLRALCVVSWSGKQVTAEMVDPALDRLDGHS